MLLEFECSSHADSLFHSVEKERSKCLLKGVVLSKMKVKSFTYPGGVINFIWP